MRFLLQPLAQTFLGLFYPNACAACGCSLWQECETHLQLCAHCKETLPQMSPPYCAICCEPFYGEISAPFECSNCAGIHFAFEAAVCPYKSAGAVREIVHRFKYLREIHLRQTLAAFLNDAFHDERLNAVPFDYIVPVPLHHVRLRTREFNQAELLAHALGKKRGIPVNACLRRVRYTTTQTQLSRTERQNNIKGAFCVKKRALSSIAGKNFLLLDDVLTTGSTLGECARVLKEAGARCVWAIAVARG